MASGVSSERFSCAARAVRRRMSSSSGTSSSSTLLRRWPRSPSVVSTSSAWAAVRGKPSKIAPSLASGFASSSLMRLKITASGTSLPSSMYFFAWAPSGGFSLTAARRMSPVVILGSLRRSARILPWVPLPDPGAPRRRTNKGSAPEPHAAATASASAAPHEAVVVPQQEVLLHLLDRVEGHADHDQQGRAAEAERHVEDARDHDGQHGDDREEDGAGQGDARQHVVDVVGRGGPGFHARNESPLLLEILRQIHRIEDDGSVEVGEKDDQHRHREEVEGRGDVEVLGQVLQGRATREGGEGARHDDQRLREDDGHHPRRVDAQRDERLLPLADPPSAHHLAGNLDRDTARRDGYRDRPRHDEHHDADHDEEYRDG